MVHSPFFSFFWTPLQVILKPPRPVVPVLRERFYVRVLKMETETEGKVLAEKNMHFSRETVVHLLPGRVKAAITLCAARCCTSISIYPFLYLRLINKAHNGICDPKVGFTTTEGPWSISPSWKGHDPFLQVLLWYYFPPFFKKVAFSFGLGKS